MTVNTKLHPAHWMAPLEVLEQLCIAGCMQKKIKENSSLELTIRTLPEVQMNSKTQSSQH